MAWEDLKRVTKGRKKKELPEGLWVLCKGCKATIYKAKVEENAFVCPECGFHFPIDTFRRINLHFDEGSFHEIDATLKAVDPLNFQGTEPYKIKHRQAQSKSRMKSESISGFATVKGVRVGVLLTDSRFLMGSMGSVMGEKIARLFEACLKARVPAITITASGGGARMYEGMVSLMQMAKTSAAVAKLNDAGVPYISILTNPTMAGVMASFASLGDVVIAEPGALIGFTGPRVIKQTINAELPKGFQSSEFLLDHGLIDMIVKRTDMRDALFDLVSYMG
ncbi:MAG: acetyl-CoA carboxylase, carboxyltransferase subunit beta [Planctomycetota bacterium]